MRNIFIFLSVLLVAGCLNGQGQAPSGHRDNMDKMDNREALEDRVATISFSGGQFWFLQEAFDEVYGVVEVTAGYTGGDTMNPGADHYADEGHQEAVSVSYQTSRIAFEDLLEVYFKTIDPTDGEGQFRERGKQFRPVIYWTEESQRLQALQYIRELEKSGIYEKPIALELERAESFYKAPDQDQHLAFMNPDAYQRYYDESGRVPRPRQKTYRKPDEEELKKNLSALQYRVSQEDATERAFDNVYWNNHEEGIYVDIASGEPLFSSKDKFESGTGWPSFTIPLVPGNMVALTDRTFGMTRTEVRSRYGDSHLGHLFPDGPHPTGLRYCINSASLRFIPVKDLEDEGYGEYLKYFKE